MGKTSTGLFLMDVVSEIAVDAGVKIMEIYGNDYFFSTTKYKEDDSPVTVADTLANEIIISGLKRIHSKTPIISEENKEVTYEERKNWKRFWLVDPLDGTKEFLKKTGEFTVNIALIENNIPILGVIYVPASDTLYTGCPDTGAFKTHMGQTKQIFSNKRDQALTSVGSISHASAEEQELLKSFDISNHVACGSSLKFCMVAEGLADIYLRSGPTMEWDIAAGHAIVKSSGGKMINKHFLDFEYNKPSLKNEQFLCIGNPALLEKNIMGLEL